MKRVIALAGNPNSGKTSLFNELTGANQYVGNWPGVTVERKGGRLKDHDEVELQDLPGIYSLSPYSPEEVVSRRYLLDEKPDLVIDVVDATNLERNLYLTSQLLETGLPVVVALNMIDLVEKKGDQIDAAALSKKLGCPVVKVSALHQTGLAELTELILGELPAAPESLPFPSCVEQSVSALRERFHTNRWQAVKMLENDEVIISELSAEDRHFVEEQRLSVERELNDDISSIIAAGRYDAIDDITKEVQKKVSGKVAFSSTVDRILTHRVAGLVIFAAVMWTIYYLSISTVGDWGTGWANDVLFGPVVGGWLAGFIGNETASVESMVMFSSVLAMCLIFPITLRRLHDIGLNGSWLYLVIAPFLLEYVCPHFPGVVHTVIMYALYLANAFILLACFTFPGSKHANKYGSTTRKFSFNPFRLAGRSGRNEYIIWFIVLSAISAGGGALGTLTMDCSDQLNSLVADGIVGGVGAVLGFLPQMAVLFLLLSLLEDCGYMARVAFMMDRIFRSIGMSGRAVIPLLVGMGCGVPAVMATRTIENEKDRRMSVMLTTFVPCGAKLPIIALFAALVGGDADIATISYFAGFGSVILGGVILRKTHMFAGSYTPFVMELPAYHTPRGANINLRAMERCKAFVHKAGTVIFLACALIWFTSNYNWKMEFLNTGEEEDAIEQSMLADVGRQFAPLFTPLGWGEWKPAVAAVTGLVAKENVVGTFGVLYSGAGEKTEDAPAEETPAAEEAPAAAEETPSTEVAAEVTPATEETPATEPEGGESAAPAAAAEAEAPAEESAEGEGEEAAEEEEEEEELPRTASLPKTNAFSALTMAVWQMNEEVRQPIEESGDEEEEEEEDEASGVAAEIKAAGTFTTVTAISFLLFNLLCAPCFAACGAIRNEMNSARWTWFAIGYMCVWAYVVALLVNQFGSWIATGTFGTGQGVACVIAVILLYLLARRKPSTPNKKA